MYTNNLKRILTSVWKVQNLHDLLWVIGSFESEFHMETPVENYPWNTKERRRNPEWNANWKRVPARYKYKPSINCLSGQWFDDNVNVKFTIVDPRDSDLFTIRRISMGISLGIPLRIVIFLNRKVYINLNHVFDRALNAHLFRHLQPSIHCRE